MLSAAAGYNHIWLYAVPMPSEPEFKLRSARVTIVSLGMFWLCCCAIRTLTVLMVSAELYHAVAVANT